MDRPTVHRVGALLLGLLALEACAPRPIVLEPPPGPPVGVEGRYRGTARLVRGDRFCPRSGPRVYEVQNGAITLAYSAGGRTRTPLTANIGPAGAFSTNDGDGRLEGAARDGNLEITISSMQCEHRWTMRKVP